MKIMAITAVLDPLLDADASHSGETEANSKRPEERRERTPKHDLCLDRQPEVPADY